MDLFQSKLTKSEWESIEVPVDHNEKQILQMIVDGYDDLNISKNNTLSMLGYLKINYNENIEKYIFDKYFLSTIKEHNKKYDWFYYYKYPNINFFVCHVEYRCKPS